MVNKALSDFSKLFYVLNTLPEAVVIVDDAGGIIFANEPAINLFGYSYAELLEKSLESLMPMRFRHPYMDHRKHDMTHPKVRPIDTDLEQVGLRKDETEFPIEMSLSPLNIDHTQLTIATIRDITERLNREKAMDILNTVMEFSSDAVIGKDLQGIIFSWSKGAEKLYGYTASEIIGQSILKLFPNDKHDELDMIMRKVNHGERLIQFKTTRIRKDGQSMPISLTIAPIYNKYQKIIGAVAIARAKELEVKLKYLSEHDRLTGLINRVLLKDRITQAMLWTKRYQACMAVFFVDLDDFKTVNDTYGHATGDKVLVAIAKRLQACLRKVDTIARVGGDEFVLILLDIADAKYAKKVARKILHNIGKSFDVDKVSIKLTCSIGVVFYPKDGDKSLLEKADAAMYYVKEHGKNNFKLFDNTCRHRE